MSLEDVYKRQRIKSLKFEIEKGGGGNNYIFVKSNNIAKQFVENSLSDGL